MIIIYIRSQNNRAGWREMNENDVILGMLPFYHTYGCLMGSASLILGARFINFSKFSFTGMLQAIQEHKVCIIFNYQISCYIVHFPFSTG